MVKKSTQVPYWFQKYQKVFLKSEIAEFLDFLSFFLILMTEC